MDSNLLKVFVAVANNNSISLGALELGFAQSNVTSRIKQLEKNIGYSLFHRTAKGVKLTVNGEKLYPHAIDIVRKVEETILQMRNINHQDLLKVASTQSNATVRLLPLIKKLDKDFPEMELEIFLETTPLVLENLLEYKSDIAFLSGNPNHKDIHILNNFAEDIYIVESKKQKSKNTILAYRKSCAYYTFLVDHLRKQKKQNYKTIVFKNYEAILGCIDLGMGISLLPKSVIEKYEYMDKLKLTKLSKEECDLSTYLVCRKDSIPMIDEYLKKINFNK